MNPQEQKNHKTAVDRVRADLHRENILIERELKGLIKQEQRDRLSRFARLARDLAADLEAIEGRYEALVEKETALLKAPLVGRLLWFLFGILPTMVMDNEEPHADAIPERPVEPAAAAASVLPSVRSADGGQGEAQTGQILCEADLPVPGVQEHPDRQAGVIT